MLRAFMLASVSISWALALQMNPSLSSRPHTRRESTVSLGFDYGTSRHFPHYCRNFADLTHTFLFVGGARISAVTSEGEPLDTAELKWSSAADAASPEAWTMALDDLLGAIPKQVRPCYSTESTLTPTLAHSYFSDNNSREKQA